MKIGLVTLYRGYNYGTSLQAYALKYFISSLGYQTEIIWLAEGAQKGRDIRLGKIAKMLWRCLWHFQLFKHTFLSYKNSFSKKILPGIKTKFLEFADEKLQVKGLAEKQLKAFSVDKDTLAVVCGSDQIWSATAANIEPLYFLRFAPEQKRVAYAPSLGSKTVSQYNKKILTKYISEIPFVSVREESGARIIKELTGREVPVLLDPTLLLDWNDFCTESIFENYIVAYFLDVPSSVALQSIKHISNKYNCRVIVFPHKYAEYQPFNNIMYYPAGPQDFICLIKGAKCVLTDSFHGTIFSINLQTPFWTFERNYASGKGQSDRIISILNKMNLQSYYITAPDEKIQNIPSDKQTMKVAKKWILTQRDVARKYLQDAFRQIKDQNE
mgnify:CR=1 FL=1